MHILDLIANLYLHVGLSMQWEYPNCIPLVLEMCVSVKITRHAVHFLHDGTVLYKAGKGWLADSRSGSAFKVL